MQDEILGKALETDMEAIPRYRIIGDNGQVLANNAIILLQNPVLQEGTPINTNTLLTEETAEKFKSPTPPQTVNEAFGILANAGTEYTVVYLLADSWLMNNTTNLPGKFIQAVNQLGSSFGTEYTTLLAVAPTQANTKEWIDSGVMCIEHSGNMIKFAAQKQPTTDIQVIIAITDISPRSVSLG